jgi:hypothetical protein
MKMADMSQMQSRIRELEARRAKGESVPELDRLYEKMDSMQNKGYTEAKKNLSGEDLVKPKSKQQKHTESLYTEQEQQAKARGMPLKEFIRSETTKANKQIKEDTDPGGYKKGGKVKKMASGGKVSSASKRADGCATKGKTKGKML